MPTSIYVYTGISPYSYTGSADYLRQQLEQANGPIVIHLHSPGGSPFEAAAMKALIEAHKHPVEIRVDGIAASAASRLLFARNAKVTATESAWLMIHKHSVLTEGNANVLASEAKALENMDESYAQEVQARTGADAKTVEGWLETDTWFNAKQMLEAGFVSELVPPVKVEARFAANFFNSAPESVLQTWGDPQQGLSEGNEMNWFQKMAAKLGLSPAATEEQVQQALESRVETSSTANSAPVSPAAEAPAVAALPQEQSAQIAQIAQVRAQLKAMHEINVQQHLDRYVKVEQKLAPNGVEAARQLCATPEGLAAFVQYMESTPKLLPQAQDLGRPAAQQLSPMALRMAQSAGLTPEAVLKYGIDGVAK